MSTVLTRDDDTPLSEQARAAEAQALALRAQARDADGKADADDRQRVLLHMPVDVRSLSLAILAVLACVYALNWAKPVFIPVLLGVMFSYALTPLVDRLERWHVPRAAGAGLLLIAILGAIGAGGWAIKDDAATFVQSLPEVAQKLRQSMQSQSQRADTLARVQQAAAEIEKAADDQAGAASAPAASGAAATRARAAAAAAATQPKGVTRVVVEKGGINVRDYLWTGTLGIVTFLGQTLVVFFITFFLLASGNTFRRKMVKLAGPKLSQKRVTIQALDEVTEQIQRYLLVQLATSAVVGVLTGVAFFAIGLEHAAVWGVAAAVTNLIPYVGSVLIGAASTLIGFIQFGTIEMALLVGGSSFAIHAVIGNLLTPWLTGRASRMSPFVVFVSVLAFGWLWGVWGLLLGVPVLMVVKSVCDRVDELKPVGEFLGA